MATRKPDVIVYTDPETLADFHVHAEELCEGLSASLRMACRDRLRRPEDWPPVSAAERIGQRREIIRAHLDPALKARIVRAAARDGESVSLWIERAIQLAIVLERRARLLETPQGRAELTRFTEALERAAPGELVTYRIPQ